MDTQEPPLHYGGFWVRFAAFWVDFLVLLPLTAIVLWANEHYRLFQLCYAVPRTMVGLFYHVYLVRRFGGTPGKLIMRLRIRKAGGGPVGFREALLRYAPDFVFGLLMSAALLPVNLKISDAEYNSLSFKQRAQRERELLPGWYKPVHVASDLWVWSEFVVLLTNRKRRALHDFIAGTVVVYNDKPDPEVS